MFKLLLSLRWYSTWGQLLWFSGYFRFLTDVGGYFRSLMDASGYLVSIEFGKIVRSVESSRFLKCKVDIGGNLRLIDLSEFLKF